MKKQARNPEKFEVLDVFAAMAAEHGYNLANAASVDEFVERVRSSLLRSKQSRTTIFGKRVESLFAYVAGALGKCKMLKQEDAGDLFFAGEEVLAPDYRLTLLDGAQVLVEVKNFHSANLKRFSFTKEYYKKLKNYSDLNNIRLLFAVYFSAWNLWTLLPIEAFDESERDFSIDLACAMAKSEMLMLGDMLIGTIPDLELCLLANPEEACRIDEEGNAEFVTRAIKIFCAGKEVTHELERRIAFYLMRFGDWVERESEPIISDGRLMGIRFSYSPENQEEPNFALVGRLSSMVSKGFRELTVKDGDVVALTLGIDPSEFSVLIPEDYKGESLPLWRFKIGANQNFKGLESDSSGR